MKSKNEVPLIFRLFHKMIKIQCGINVKILRSDNGGE